MRKISGFSLVELTIVLIIVGIIIAMFMGGVNFMEKARVKTELGKLTKFSSAMTTYYAQNGGLPPDLSAAIWGTGVPSDIRFYEPTSFEDFGLTKADFKSNYQKNRNDLSYILSSCWPYDNDGDVNSDEYTNGPDGASTVAPTDDPSHMVCVYFNNFLGRFICNLEKSVDDKRVDLGDGMVWNSTYSTFGFTIVSDPSTTTSVGKLSDDVSCDDDTIGDKSGSYGYKIFQF
jgi:prepilin-type N-terminal cleavage/methylation domain-containing protein